MKEDTFGRWLIFLIGLIAFSWIFSSIVTRFCPQETVKEVVVEKVCFDTIHDTVVNTVYVDAHCLSCPSGYLLGTFAGEYVCYDRDGWWSSVYPVPKKSKISP